MPRNGSGAFERVHDWTDDADAAINIRADRMDEEFDGIAQALTDSIAKDGQTVPTAHLPMGGYKLTGLGAPASNGDALSWGAAARVTSLGIGIAAAVPLHVTETTGGAVAIFNSTNSNGGYFRLDNSSTPCIDFGSAKALFSGMALIDGGINVRNSSGVLALGINSTELLRINGTAIQPGADNTYNSGAPSFRWGTVYAGTGTINTSGAETKANVRPLSASELAVAKALAKLVRVYQFCDAVTSKGEDKARIHTGVIYEDVVAAFEAQGLDPFRYGIVCRDLAADGETWICGVRYAELAQFVIAGLNARLEALEG